MKSTQTNSYRLLACDLDGTLMSDDTVIPPHIRQALAEAQSRGIRVTLATGRGFPETLPYAQQLGIQTPLICYQGGLIQDPNTHEILYHVTMDRELVQEVIDLARARDWHLVVYIGDELFINEFRHPPGFYRRMLGLNLKVGDLSEALCSHATDPFKFLVVAEEPVAEQTQTELASRFHERMQIVRSHVLFVEGSPLAVSKGDALRRLAEHLEIPRGQVMAIGDQGNDVSMIDWAGLGVAMGNGSPAVKAVADWVAPPFARDGAVAAINRFLLNRAPHNAPGASNL